MENKNEPLFFPGGVHITYYTIQLNCTHEQHAHSVWAYTPPVEFTSHYFDTIYTCSVLLSKCKAVWSVVSYAHPGVRV